VTRTRFSVEESRSHARRRSPPAWPRWSRRARGPLSAAEAADCGFWLATDYLALGSTQAARRELRQVMQAAPRYEVPPFTSPKVLALLREVREELERAPRLRALPPRHTPDGLVLLFEPSRTGGTAYGAVYWRWQGEHEWREAPLGHAGENLKATLVLSRGGTLEYWAEMRAPDGTAVAGSRDKPLQLPAVTPSLGPVGPRQWSLAWP
jgi:hypothetical protein